MAVVERKTPIVAGRRIGTTVGVRVGVTVREAGGVGVRVAVRVGVALDVGASAVKVGEGEAVGVTVNGEAKLQVHKCWAKPPLGP